MKDIFICRCHETAEGKALDRVAVVLTVMKLVSKLGFLSNLAVTWSLECRKNIPLFYSVPAHHSTLERAGARVERTMLAMSASD